MSKNSRCQRYGVSRTFKSEFKHSEADRGLWYPVHDPLNAGEREAFPLREKSPVEQHPGLCPSHLVAMGNASVSTNRLLVLGSVIMSWDKTRGVETPLAVYLMRGLGVECGGGVWWF